MSAPQTIIEQAKPAATTLTDLYTPGAGRRARVRVIACSQAASDDVRISIARSGAANAATQYVAYDLTVSQDLPYAVDLTCEGTDVIRVYSTGGNVSFTVNGYEDDIPSA